VYEGARAPSFFVFGVLLGRNSILRGFLAILKNKNTCKNTCYFLVTIQNLLCPKEQLIRNVLNICFHKSEMKLNKWFVKVCTRLNHRRSYIKTGKKHQSTKVRPSDSHRSFSFHDNPADGRRTWLSKKSVRTGVIQCCTC